MEASHLYPDNLMRLTLRARSKKWRELLNKSIDSVIRELHNPWEVSLSGSILIDAALGVRPSRLSVFEDLVTHGFV